MEEIKQDNMQNCSCGHHCGWGHGHHLLRFVLGILLLGLVFALGVKLGEFKAEVRGYGYMPLGGYYGNMPQRVLFYGNGAIPNMMYQVTTATPVTTLPAGAK